MIQASVFLNIRTQAVRFPKAVALDDDVHQGTVDAGGRAREIAPVGESWNSWFDGPGVSPDFMAERDQPAMQERAAL